MTEAKAASEEGYHLTLALAFSDKASYRAGGAQGLDRCATRATGPDQVASSISTAWAALTADVPVLHGAPGGIRLTERLSETPMQDLPEDIADGIHVACVQVFLDKPLRLSLNGSQS